MEKRERKLIGKYFLKGKIVLKTGLHIGSSRDVMNIGGVDSPVVRDPLTMRPYIPGSSLKGKLRSLSELALGKKLIEVKGGSNKIRRHECLTYDDAKNCEICRLFGASKGDNFPSRFIVRDAHLSEESAKVLSNTDTDAKFTELKSENSIDRITSGANPRTFERVPAGAEFDFEIIYNIEDEDQKDDDIKNLKGFFRLLEDDYLGGGGSRGSGKVKIEIEEEYEKRAEDYIEVQS